MYDSSSFPASLSEETFHDWLENGRKNNMGFRVMLVIWDAYDEAYKPIYAEKLEAIDDYEHYNGATSRESLIAAYDLYSESKIA